LRRGQHRKRRQQRAAGDASLEELFHICHFQPRPARRFVCVSTLLLSKPCASSTRPVVAACRFKSFANGAI
jgi:hypothetical protein